MSTRKRLFDDRTGGVASPFLDEDLFAGESAKTLKPRAAALAAASPYAFEHGWRRFDSPELEEAESFDGESFSEGETDDESDETAEGTERVEPEEQAFSAEPEEADQDEHAEWRATDDATGYSESLQEFEKVKAPLPPLGRPDFWPDAVYIAKPQGDSFLNSAREFHKLWGFKPVEFESLEGLIGLIAKAKAPERRIRVISHAWDGFMIPLFRGSPAGFTITQKQIESLNAGDSALVDELLGTLVDLDKATDQGNFAWQALLISLESTAQDALKPFGLTSRTRPTGDLALLLRRCADLVAVAPANVILRRAVRKSIAGAQDRLKRSKAEVEALQASVAASGFAFGMTAPTQDMLNRLQAVVSGLDDRAFRKTLANVHSRLKGKWLDFRGCRIGQHPKYLEAFAALMGTDGCTAPDWWSGYPGLPIGDKQVKSANSLKSLVQSSTAAAAMDAWGSRQLAGWNTIAAADRPERFFHDFLVGQHGVFPVYEVVYSGRVPKQKHTLFWNSSSGKERWFEAMWDRAPEKLVKAVARGWGGKTPRMPTLSLHLKTGSQADPQQIRVAPEPEFRDHIIEAKKP